MSFFFLKIRIWYCKSNITYTYSLTCLSCLSLSDVVVLFNTELAFPARLYGALDVDVCRIKLHEPLSLIVQQPLLYVRDMVPKACFQALVKLDQVGINATQSVKPVLTDHCHERPPASRDSIHRRSYISMTLNQSPKHHPCC